MPDHRFRVFRRGSNSRAIILRVTKSEYAELEVLADEADIGVSTVVKQLLRQALSRGVVVVEDQGPEEPDEAVPEGQPVPQPAESDEAG
jgi:hypothetical protein